MISSLSRTNFERFLLALGFAVVSMGILVGWFNPAIEYELDIYAETPLFFWGSVAVGLTISIYSTFLGRMTLSRVLGAGLGLISMTAIVSLPIVRGYHHVGGGDALSHLGTTRDLNAGLLSMTDIRYPVIHTIVSLMHDISGVTTNHALLIIVSLFVLTFFVFIPLSVRILTMDKLAVSIALFAGFLLLPINHVSGHMQAHPTSQAVMFAPVLLFVFLACYLRFDCQMVVLFLLVSLMYVLLHPQQAANYVILFGAIAIVQLIAHLRRTDRSLTIRPIYPIAGLFGVFFWIWAENLDAFRGSLSSVMMSIFTLFEDDVAAQSVVTRGVSLEQVGGSIGEVFLKLFGVSLIFSTLAGLLMLAIGLNAVDIKFGGKWWGVLVPEDPLIRKVLLYLSIGFVAVSSLFVIYLVAGITDQYFRHYAFMMGIVTIFGALSLSRILRGINDWNSSIEISKIATISFLLFLAISIPVVFASPFFYQSSGHVTEAEMHGFETTFFHAEDSYSFDHVRSPASRYGIAINGPTYQDRREYYRAGVRRGGVPDHFADRNLPAYFDEPVYLTVTGKDRIRDPILYQGFRFSHDDFAYLDREPLMQRIVSNGELDVYLVDYNG